jgi:hypothetical protein
VSFLFFLAGDAGGDFDHSIGRNYSLLPEVWAGFLSERASFNLDDRLELFIPAESCGRSTLPLPTGRN